MELPEISKDDIKGGLDVYRWMAAHFAKLKTVLGKNQYLLITGMQGVGKTDLFHHMTGRAFEPEYRPPTHTSPSVEDGKLRRHFGMKVIPGQASKVSWDAIEDTLLGKSPPIGIIHVVANGYATIRSDAASTNLDETNRFKKIESVLAAQRQEEFEDLKQLCGWVRQAHRSGLRPAWLMLAVSKYDLYSEDADFQKNYFPGGNGEFVEQIERLKSQIGSDNFRWQAASVCSSPISYHWKGEVVPSGISPERRKALLFEFMNKVLGLC